MYLLLLVFVLIIIKIDKKSISSFLLFLIITSFVSLLLVSDNVIDISLSHFLYAAWVLISLLAIVMPWKRYTPVTSISVNNSKKMDIVAKFLSIYTIILTLYCLYIFSFVYSGVDDINRYKYQDGSAEFLYSLGISMKPYMLVIISYPISYTLIPLHFYYLSKNRAKMSIFCFIGSLLTITYGLTYFSRFHIIHYLLLYAVFFFFLRKTLSKKTKKNLTIIASSLGGFLIAAFLFISFSRFESYTYSNQNHNSIVHNQTLYSMFDYFSMWWPHGQDLFDRYELQSYYGMLSFQSISYFIKVVTFGVIPDFCSSLPLERIKIWKEYSGSFTGFPIYSLYDYGPFLALFVYYIYYKIVRKKRPINNSIKIEWLLYMSLFIQIPLYSTFYSTMNILLIGILLMYPINIYLKTSH